VSSPGDPNRVTGNEPAALAALRPHDRRDPWLRTGPNGVICGVGLVIPLARLAALLLTVWAVPDPARESPRRAASAWKDGKSHRAFAEMPARPGAGQGLAIYGRYEGGLVR
jgi:hypothetical protein